MEGLWERGRRGRGLGEGEEEVREERKRFVRRRGLGGRRGLEEGEVWERERSAWSLQKALPFALNMHVLPLGSSRGLKAGLSKA